MADQAFVTAQWSDLLLLTYRVPDALVRPSLPAGVEPDRWRGEAHVNLVAMRFEDIRMRGRRVPGIREFAQVNLRTYALYEGVPGVVFIRQLVPSALVSAVARLRYRQPYDTLPITHVRAVRDGAVTAEYMLDHPPRGCVIATGSERSTVPPEGSLEHWCTERFWGFGPARPGRGLMRFRVDHPTWAVREVRDWQLSLDFGAFFGPTWRPLNDGRPVSVVFAVGSAVSVYEPSVISHQPSARSRAGRADG